MFERFDTKQNMTCLLKHIAQKLHEENFFFVLPCVAIHYIQCDGNGGGGGGGGDIVGWSLKLGELISFRLC